MFPEVDVQQIRKDYPLTARAGQDVDLHFRKGGTEARGPCPRCKTGDDRFGISIPDQTFWCRRCKKDFRGDVIQYVMIMEDLSFIDAVAHLTGNKPSSRPQNGKLVGRPHAQEPLSGDLFWEWSNKLEILTTQAHAHLVERRCEGAEAAAQWLEARGINQKLIEHHGLGFNDHWREIIPGYKLPPGLTLPRWRAGDTAVMACNVYLSKEARESTGCNRMFARGSSAKTFFNEWRIPYAKTVIIVEGELDCILLSKFLGPFVLAVTTGGAQTIPDDLSILKGRHVILALDNDQAGALGRDKWLDKLPGATVATVPAGNKDITDLWKSSGNVTAWISDYL